MSFGLKKDALTGGQVKLSDDLDHDSQHDQCPRNRQTQEKCSIHDGEHSLCGCVGLRSGIANESREDMN